MRPILFRGIPKRSMDFDFYRRAFPFPGNAYDGSFALGSLIVDKDSDRAYISCSAIVTMNCTVGNAQCCAIEVEPDSVGEYIGLIDKNEKLIFEGDIVLIECEGDYCEGEFRSIWHDKARIVWLDERYGWYAKFYDGELLSMEEYDGHSEDVEVIGNIHDNPDLLEDMAE